MDGMETGLKMVSVVTMVIEIVMGGFCFYCLARPFLVNKRGALWSALAYILVLVLLYKSHLLLGYSTAYSLGTLSAFVIMCLTDRRNYEQKIFITITFFALRWLTLGVAEILYDNIYSFAETNFLPEYPNMWFELFVMVCSLYQLLEIVFLLFSIWCILKACVYRHAQMSKRELFMLSIPSFTSVAGYEIIMFYRLFYISKNGSNTDTYDVLALLYYAVSFITIVVVIVLYQHIKVNQEEKLQNEMLAAQVNNIRHHIERVEGLYQHIRSMNHDMKNHMLTLENLYAGNRIEEAQAYSSELKESMSYPALSDEIKTGNPVTDMIIQEMKNEAEKREIRFHSEFFYPSGSDINAFDISVILNNALQNAVENAGDSEAPCISIISYRQNNAYMLEIKNSFSGQLLWDEDTGLPRTAKKDSPHQSYGYEQHHGFGISNIRRVARKYAGDIDIVHNAGEFCLCVMLMLEMADNNF